MEQIRAAIDRLWSWWNGDESENAENAQTEIGRRSERADRHLDRTSDYSIVGVDDGPSQLQLVQDTVQVHETPPRCCTYKAFNPHRFYNIAFTRPPAR